MSHRRSQDFVWGALFPEKKLTTLFLVVAFKRRSTTTNWSSESSPHKMSQNWLLLCLGCTWCAGGTLTNFSCKLRLNFFLRPGGCRCTHCTLCLCLWRCLIIYAIALPNKSSFLVTSVNDIVIDIPHIALTLRAPLLYTDCAHTAAQRLCYSDGTI